MSKPFKILIIDDEAAGRQLLEAILTPETYDVIIGENGEDGLELATTEMPDLILCDVIMPGMDGFEVCQKIRENGSTNHIPVFLITALDDRDSRIKGIGAGADDYISKPFDRVEIAAKIKNTLYRLESRHQGVSGTTVNPYGNHSINPNLLEGLIRSFIDRIENDKNIKLYSSSEKVATRHIFLGRSIHNHLYYFLVSNSLNPADAAILNCTLINLLLQYSAENFPALYEMINQVNTQKEMIISSLELNDKSNVSVSIAAIRKSPGEETIQCSGINQTLLVDSGPFESNSAAKPNYQPYHLTDKKDICLKTDDHLLLISPYIHVINDMYELHTFVNMEIEKNGEEGLTSSIPDKFNLTRDVLVVKLTF